jgi:hypothetical protein
MLRPSKTGATDSAIEDSPVLYELPAIRDVKLGNRHETSALGTNCFRFAGDWK